MSFKRARTLELAGGAFTVDPEAHAEDTESLAVNGQKFRKFLLEKYSSGSMTAADTCTLAYLHTESGGRGAEDLGLDPEIATKHGAGHLRYHLGKHYEKPYVEYVAVPMVCKKSIGRVSVQHPTRVASDMLRRELLSLRLLGEGANADTEFVTAHLDADREYLGLYEGHPVAQKAFAEGFRREHVVPVSVYFDGVQYSKNENFLGFYMTNLRTRKQQLVWLLRLSELCSCGCRGWCSVFPLLESFRRDMCFDHKDLRVCILDYKADWPAYIEICGFRTWSHNLHPCPICTVQKKDLLAVGTMTLHTCPHKLFDETSYKELEIVVPDEETKMKIESLLVYRRKTGRGRCLKASFPLLRLRQGWRLEPSPSLPDVGNFAKQSCPFSCVFYIGGKHGRVLHQSPFLQIPGVSVDTWCVDILHTWHYGPMSTFIAYGLRLLLTTMIYRPLIPDLEKEEADRLALLCLRAELWSYYKRLRQFDDDGSWKTKGSEVWNLTLTMVAGKYVKAKAAETHGLLGFLVDRLEMHKCVLAATEQADTFALLLQAGQAALHFDAVMASHPRAIDETVCGLLFQTYDEFICLCEKAEMHLMPKSHMMYHMLQRAVRKGNPRMYSTYIDESLNGHIARICRSVHRRTWAYSVYEKLEMMDAIKADDDL
ncbi:unnamed protein product [Symbiodinium sp. CCMP2592]|nr:unnamed protein product [Symbiodinium sp. CCMP2592]